jgi:hypothetical protein
MAASVYTGSRYTVGGGAAVGGSTIGSIGGKRKPTYDDMLHILTPRNVGLQQLFKKFAKESINDDVFRYFVDEYQPMMDYVVSGAGLTDITSKVIVCSIPYWLQVGDMVKCDRTDELFYASTATTSASSNTLERGVANAITGNSAAADLVAGDVLRKVGTLAQEGSKSFEATSTVETEKKGYVQDFETTFAMTEKAMNAANYTGQDMPYQQAKAAKEHAWKIEQALLFGSPVAGAASGTGVAVNTLNAMGLTDAPCYATAGLAWYMKNSADSHHYVDAGGVMSRADFITRFLVPNLEIGSDHKFMYAGLDILAAIDYWKLGIMQMTPADKAFDMDVTTWNILGRKVKIIEHEFLNKPYIGTVSKGAIAFLIDMEAPIKYMEQFPTRLDDMVIEKLSVNSGKPKGVVKRFYTSAGLKVVDPNRHGMLYNFTGYTA